MLFNSENRLYQPFCEDLPEDLFLTKSNLSFYEDSSEPTFETMMIKSFGVKTSYSSKSIFEGLFPEYGQTLLDSSESSTP